MKADKRYALLLSFQKALLFNVTFHTRLILADVHDNKKLIMWAYLDRAPTDDEKDVYYSVSAEVAGDFVDLDDAISEVHFLTENINDEDLRDKLLLFARCDYIDLDGNLK